MAYARKRKPSKFSKKSFRKRRSTFRKRNTKRRRTSTPGNYFRCKLKDLTVPLIINNSLTANFYQFDFRAANAAYALSNYKFQWDQYRIRSVHIKAEVIGTEFVTKPFDDVSGAATTTPSVCWCVDRDDIGTPTSFSEVNDRATAKRCLMNQPWSLTFRPTPLKMMFISALSTAYACDATKSWIDSSNMTLPMYGLKIAVQPASPTQGWGYNLLITYDIEFRNRRQ